MSSKECSCSKCEGLKTINNLQIGFNGESNAAARYTVYAKHAEDLGYLGVSALFTASAAAERIHAARHEKVGIMLGAVLTADIKEYHGKEIDKMLNEVLGAEVLEATETYPAFIQTAEEENQRMAVVSFEGSMKTENEHARLCALAVKDLEGWKMKKNFYVCTLCGWTKEDHAPESCPVCSCSAFVEF
ncbi:MAG: ferritin family protein [Planctomycetia bacterium]|nr:ferritin family protein [Planctomycetia bacterium]